MGPINLDRSAEAPSLAQMLEDQVPTARNAAMVTDYTRDLASTSFAESR